MPSSQYISDLAEPKWYAYWLTHKLFASSPNDTKEPYVVLMPPPNITGVLHMGHVLNYTKQDILVRRARMQGKEACWVPGLDHASIATEAKVVALLKEKGLEKKEIGRQAFLAHAMEWKEKYGTIILDQQRRLGVSCDWDRLAFTMDAPRSESVQQAFIALYDQGYIYRGHRIINWDPAGQTALSDDEVIYREVQSNFYHINYAIVGSEETVTVATTRPETLLGDTALCVHPEDTRYQHLIGKKAYVPLIRREIPVITDTYVDRELGTGCLKVTPAHDPNDYALSLTHDLAIIDILHPDGTLNPAAQRYVGQDRMVARKKIVQDLEKEGCLVKTLPHVHQVGFSERTDAVVEPRLSTQWFIKMHELAQPAIENVKDGSLSFYPDKFKNTYNAWLKNVRDWCISRQLWWGHRIPAYYLPDGRFVVAATIEEALEKAKTLTNDPNLTADALTQDEDVLDTWFSSALWPMTVFDGIRHPDNKDYTYYYPTNDLVTGPDIIFFWVARMVMAGHVFTQQIPFKNVYFTGIVRDKKGRKMSKSLGNSPDPLELMRQYGADGIRAGMLFSTPAGNDLLFDVKLCEQGQKFVHKLWNAHKLLKSWQPVEQPIAPAAQTSIEWFHARYASVHTELTHSFEQFRLSEAFIILYKCIWDDFCAHYLEMIKPPAGQAISSHLYQETLGFFEKLLTMLHPFMPFITEEIWHQLRPRQEKECIALQPWPRPSAPTDPSILAEATHAFDLITRIRHLKRTYAHPANAPLSLHLKGPLPAWVTRFSAYITKQAKLQNITSQPAKPSQGHAFVLDKCEWTLPEMKVQSDPHTRKELQDQLAHREKFADSIHKKLANPQFIKNAPSHVVTLEKKKLADTQGKIKALKELLDSYRNS